MTLPTCDTEVDIYARDRRDSSSCTSEAVASALARRRATRKTIAMPGMNREKRPSRLLVPFSHPVRQTPLRNEHTESQVDVAHSRLDCHIWIILAHLLRWKRRTHSFLLNGRPRQRPHPDASISCASVTPGRGYLPIFAIISVYSIRLSFLSSYAFLYTASNLTHASRRNPLRFHQRQ